VKRCLKRLGFTFRRARRVPEKAPSVKQQERVKRTLVRLHRLEDAGQCQVLYTDESGFCLSPSLPYLWQKKGQTVGLPAKAHSRRLNVLGFLGKDNRLHSFQTQERITAEFVIESIEALLPTLPGPTVLVLDNASVHRSKLVQARRKEWKKKGLRLLFLPPYCPHLNLIEILWRMVKYRWLDCAAYADFQTLCQCVTNILAKVGTQYQISFA
jgi:transposase